MVKKSFPARKKQPRSRLQRFIRHIPLILFGLLLLWSVFDFLRAASRENYLVKHGKIATGNVTKVTGRFNLTYYTFDVNGQFFTSSTNRSLYLKIGDSIQVIYKVEDPAINLPYILIKEKYDKAHSAHP